MNEWMNEKSSSKKNKRENNGIEQQQLERMHF